MISTQLSDIFIVYLKNELKSNLNLKQFLHILKGVSMVNGRLSKKKTMSQNKSSLD